MTSDAENKPMTPPVRATSRHQPVVSTVRHVPVVSTSRRQPVVSTAVRPGPEARPGPALPASDVW